MGVARELLLRASRNAWLAERLPRRRFVRRAVRRFLPGEALSDAVGAANSLAASRVATVLTILGENVARAEDTGRAVDGYDDALAAIASAGLDTDLSVKPTHLGLDIDADLAERNLSGILARAGTRLVALDMEASPYVDRTLDLYRALRVRHANVGVCLQAYLYRTREDLESLLPLGPMIRLVKGAYAEPADLAWPRKSDVDESYLLLATRMLEAQRSDPGMRPAFGTHDARLVAEIRRRADELGVSRDGFEFQLLYGIRRDLQESLARAGYRVRVLVSYGPQWFPWYMRRLAERPANVGFVLRSMAGR